MSATNTTTNYNLPIFIGSDKPAWLVDFNGAMNAIDAQMKTNADAIATKSPILTFNDTTEIDFTKTGDVITASLASGVSDKVGRALVKPISAPAADQIVGIDTNGDQAAFDIGSGLFNDSGTLKAVDLNLTATQIELTDIVVETTGFSLTTNTGNMAVAKNADGTIGKIYGRLRVTNSTSSNSACVLRLPVKVAAIDSAIAISPAGLSQVTTATSGGPISLTTVVNIATDGTIKLSATIFANKTMDIYFFPSLYFFKDFGDVG